MNVKKGFFRLWVLFTIIFISCVLVVSFDRIKMQFQSSKDITNEEWEVILPVPCDSARGKPVIDYTNNLEGYCWYSLEKLRQFYPEYNDIPDSAIANNLYKKEEKGLKAEREKTKNQKYLIRMFIFALGIPMLIFLFGYSFTWVYSGFKSSK